MPTIKEQLEGNKPATGVWKPPAPAAEPSKVPKSAVTEQAAPVFGGTPAGAINPHPLKTVEGPKGHTVTIKHLEDLAQKFAFLAQCSCQFEGRAKTEVDINTTVQRHFERHE
jgi:hypothetical protein